MAKGRTMTEHQYEAVYEHLVGLVFPVLCEGWLWWRNEAETQWDAYRRRHPGPPRRVSAEASQRAADSWR